MNYSLGNMLSGGGSLNADKLSLDLQFAADKTLVARKGPTPTFTRASTATFVGSNGLIQSAAINAARFDHDPITLACKGLLIEESRTNQILQSEDFNTTWFAIGASVSVNAATSPNGLVTADKLILDLSSITGRVQQATTLTGSYTFSVFLKASEWSWAFITPSAVVGGVWFNLSNGTIGTQQAGCVGSIVSYGNGWYRCSVILTGTGVISSTRITPTNADNTITAGNGTSGIFAWGVQLEAGSFPTSYIPTTTASVVRSADVCSITGSDLTGFYNTPEGTFVSKFVYGNPTPTFSLLIDTNGNNAPAISLTSANGLSAGLNGRFSINSTVTLIRNSIHTVAFGYKVSDHALTVDGSAVSVSTNASVPVTPTTLTFGSRAATSTNGHIQSIRYYKKRLANAKLQALTV